MEAILGTKRNLSLDLVGDTFKPAAELILITADVDYSVNSIDHTIHKGLSHNTYRFKLSENDIDTLISTLLSIKHELTSFNVDITSTFEETEDK